MEATNEFTGWAIVEIMGHQKYAGHVSTQAIGGASMIRVDVPAVDGHAAFSKLFGVSSIYCLTPVSEEVATAMARSLRKAPVNAYEFPQDVLNALRTAGQPRLTAVPADDHQDDEDDYDR